MRGKGIPSGAYATPAGITPAHAGKSQSAYVSHAHTPDHPRPCGEKPIDLLFARREPGSPPPMRGKVASSSFICARIGITPAHAGKRAAYDSFVPDRRDHPRPCGEKQSALSTCPSTSGSPPPMRGKGLPHLGRYKCMRITPAHAGKSSSGSR